MTETAPNIKPASDATIAAIRGAVDPLTPGTVFKLAVSSMRAVLARIDTAERIMKAMLAVWKDFDQEIAAERALVKRLRADLAAFTPDHKTCERCDAPLGGDDDMCTVSDAVGCWGSCSDAQGKPCYRYRTEKGADLSWPPCAAIASLPAQDRSAS